MVITDILNKYNIEWQCGAPTLNLLTKQGTKKNLTSNLLKHHKKTGLHIFRFFPTWQNHTF